MNQLDKTEVNTVSVVSSWLLITVEHGDNCRPTHFHELLLQHGPASGGAVGAAHHGAGHHSFAVAVLHALPHHGGVSR